MLRIDLKKDQRLFFTSDTHYYHKNLCSGTTDWRNTVEIEGETIKVVPHNTRKFDTLEEMNDRIVTNINSMVRSQDILISLGDWSFRGFDKIKEFRDRILCKNIYIITGNHDHHIVNNKDNIRSLFTEVREYYTPLVVNIDGVRHSFILSHFPICSWDNMSKGRIHLFGHVHLPKEYKVREGRSMDVGMDGNDLFPYSLEEIWDIMKDQPVKHMSLPRDYHDDEPR